MFLHLNIPIKNTVFQLKDLSLPLMIENVSQYVPQILNPVMKANQKSLKNVILLD